MFAVVYSFKVNKGKDKEFILAWRKLTEFIYQYEGSLGSRLHQLSEHEYIAYANWPTKELWKNSGDKLPDEANVYRGMMREACEAIDTIYEMEVVDDFLKKDPFSH